jgi:ribosomal protein S27E
MNLVTLECPRCRGMIQVDSSAAGRQVECPLCTGTMQIPSAEALAAAPPTPPPAYSQPPPVPPPMPPMPRGMPRVPVDLMSVACPSCGGTFQVPPSTAGMQLPCPACRQLVSIPEMTGPSLPADASEPVESLLPPGAANAATLPGEQMPLPAAPRPAFVAPATEGDRLVVQERPKVMGEGHEAVELRRLSPEEKARRRAVRNAILFLLGLAVLLAYIVYKSRG